MKTILLPFYDDEVAQTALDTAFLVADRFASYVEGLFVMRPPQIFDGEGIALAGSYMTQLKEEGRRLADAAKGRFETALRSRGLELVDVRTPVDGVSVGWQEMEGLEGQIIGDYGRLFDLAVIGRNFGQPWIDWSVMSEAALFESGRPVLIGAATAPGTLGDNVVIAWNCSTETARTVTMAMPFLVGANNVVVVTEEPHTVPGPSGEQLAAHLVRNGVNASAKTLQGDRSSPGAQVLEECANVGADLIVKGAYTHSRLRQMVFGGVTRHLLTTAEIPLLMAH